MFENINTVKQRLIDYLYTINENINWLDFINRYGTLSDTKIFKRIRSLVWVDKSIEYDSNMHLTTKYFEYYIKLLSKFTPITSKYPIHIIPPNPAKPSKNNEIIEEFALDIANKFSILCRILNIYHINYEVIDVTDVKSTDDIHILMPSGSLMYTPEELKIFDDFRGIVIPDGYDNLCFEKGDDILNNFILNIKALMMSADDVSDIIKDNYTMFHVQKRE